MGAFSIRRMPSQVGAKNYNAKKVKNAITGEEYPTVKDAANACGLTPSYLVQMLKGWRENTSGMVYARKKSNIERAKW